MTDKEKKVLLYVIIGLILLLIASIILNITQYNDLHNREDSVITIEKHDTVTVHDTTTIENPVPVSVKPSKETVKIPVEIVKTDTVFIELPKTEKVYKDDSTYECQVSGIEPNLDYIKVYPKTTIITNEKIVTNTIKYRPHFNWGIQTGFGYGITQKKVDIYVGLGAQYSF